MSRPVVAALVRPFLVLGLIIATLGFGLAGLCGAVFTLSALPHAATTLFSDHAASLVTSSFFRISLPSLLIGGVGAWWCGRKLWKWLNA